MNHEEALDAVVAACRALNKSGIPMFALYHDNTGWHLAGPMVAGDTLAATLRLVAESCEEQLPPEGAVLN